MMRQGAKQERAISYQFTDYESPYSSLEKTALGHSEIACSTTYYPTH